MSEKNNDEIIFKELRSRSAETDIKQFLKSTLGGYTKSSVLEHLAVLRKQQQAMADTFSANQQMLFEEKERLTRDNESLKARLALVESEYKNLTESLRSQELVGAEFTVSDVVALRNNVASLEDELSRRDIEISRFEFTAEQLNRTVEEYRTQLDQSDKEKQAVREMLKAEMLESKKQRNMVSRLSASLEEKMEEINFLNSSRSSDHLSILTGKVNELTEQLKAQSEIMESCNSESSFKQQKIETLSQENSSLKQSIFNLTKSLEEMHNQNDKLMFANTSLSDQLESEYKRSISLIKEKSGLSMEKLSVTRKLDEAVSKVAQLEQQVSRHMDTQEMDAVFKSSEQLN